MKNKGENKNNLKTEKVIKESRRQRKERKYREKNKFGKTMYFIAKIIKLIILMSILLGVFLGALLVNKYMPEYKMLSKEADEIIANIDSNTFTRQSPTLIIRDNGEVVREFKHVDYKYIEEDSIPIYIKDAFVSIEDKSFYTHFGIDIKSNIRAAKALIVNKGEITQGASTITQQLIKNVFLTNKQSYERKIREVILSLKLERKLSKNKILEYYINNIYFGNGAYGIGTASNLYFNKDVNELNLSEITFLVAIPNNPTTYDPIQNKDNTIKRRDRVLEHMLQEGKISELQLKEAKSYNVELNIKDKGEYLPESYEVSYVMNSAVKLIMEYEKFELKYEFANDSERDKYDESFQLKFNEINDRLRTGGYVITSTIKPEKQKELQISLNEGLAYFKNVDSESGLYETQGAGVVIDNKSNELIAIVGGRTQEEINNSFNRAFLSYRQPGSVIKPIVVYGVEVDNGMLSSTMLVDEDNKDGDGPKNSYKKHLGKITAREALERSVNTIPFNLMKEGGYTSAHKYMNNMEFSKIVDGDKNASIAIGGFTYGTSPLEIAGAYATLANNGEYIRPTGISKIMSDDTIIYTNYKKGTPVYNDGTAYLLTDMLKGVISEKHGTGNKQSLGKQPVAGKTGTTDDSKDGWFAGYTPYFTTVVWVGNDMPKPIKGLFGGSYPGQIWQDYMKKVHNGLPLQDFTMPENTEVMYLNPKTGEISQTEKKDYTNKEIIPAAYKADFYTKLEKARAEEKAIAERKKQIERERLEAELKAEQERKEEFKKEYGVEEHVELKNKSHANDLFNTAMNISINSNDDYEQALTLLDEAFNFSARLLTKQNREQMTSLVLTGYPNLENKLKDMFLTKEKERLRKESQIEIENQNKETEKERLDKIDKIKAQAEIDAKKAIERENIIKAEEEKRAEEKRAEEKRAEEEREVEEEEMNPEQDNFNN